MHTGFSYYSLLNSFIMKAIYFFLFSLCLQAATAQPLQRVAPEQVGMDSRKLMYADEAIETAISNKPCCGPSGHRGTPCCWTSPLPVWTRLPYRPASPCCGSGWRAVRCCWPPTTVPPSTHWAGRCWSCRSWHSRVRLAIPQTKDYNKG